MKKNKACVVLPTYNERKNIQLIVPALLKKFKELKKWDMQLLIVDDNSPDGTGKIARSYARKHKNISVISGQKNGLGAAYIRGFSHIIHDVDVMIMMDADLSHDPKRLPALLDKIEQGYDFVIGSRYIPGGDTPDWSFRRKLISKGGNFFARVLGGLYKVKDCTSGYRAIRTFALQKIDFSLLATRGYAFQKTLLYELAMSGAKIAEIPIVFYDRKFGESKLSTKDMIEFFLNATRLRLRTNERFTKFLTVGMAGVLLNTLLLWMFTAWDVPLLAAGALAIEIAIVFNFIMNEKYTFKDNIDDSSFFTRMLKFNGVAAYGFLVNLSALYLLTQYTQMGILLANLIGIMAAMLFNYVAVMDYTWRVRYLVYHPEPKTLVKSVKATR